MSTVIIVSILDYPGNVSVVNGSVDGTNTTASVSTSAIEAFTDVPSAQMFCATALYNTIPPAPVPYPTDLTGTVTVGS